MIILFGEASKKVFKQPLIRVSGLQEANHNDIYKKTETEQSCKRRYNRKKGISDQTIIENHQCRDL